MIDCVHRNGKIYWIANYNSYSYYYLVCLKILFIHKFKHLVCSSLTDQTAKESTPTTTENWRQHIPSAAFHHISMRKAQKNSITNPLYFTYFTYSDILGIVCHTSPPCMYVCCVCVCVCVCRWGLKTMLLFAMSNVLVRSIQYSQLYLY